MPLRLSQAGPLRDPCRHPGLRLCERVESVDNPKTEGQADERDPGWNGSLFHALAVLVATRRYPSAREANINAGTK